MGSPPEHDQHTDQFADDSQSIAREPPPPPEPSTDAGIVPPIKSPHLQGLEHLTVENVDIFTLDAVAALKLLCRGAQYLVDTMGMNDGCHKICVLTNVPGDVPPTPAIQNRIRNFAPESCQGPVTPEKSMNSLQVPGHLQGEDDNIDGVPFTRTPIGSPEAHLHEPIVHGSTSQPASIQYAALVRKFYSKRPPPISLEDYLTRMHKFCPMSTAVYIATSLYITRLAVEDKVCPVTPRNVHRLVLAGLRIAMKALEDLKWPHGRFAKVGGVSEAELARLEIGFCFLMDFTLKVDAKMLTLEVQNLIRLSNMLSFGGHLADPASMQLSLPAPRNKRNGGDSSNEDVPRSTAEKRKASSSLPVRPLQHSIGIVGQS